jgi:hypothetical protein
MEEITNKQLQINNLREEIEADKKELKNVPDRFIDLIKTRIEEKVSLILKLENEIQILVDGSRNQRLIEIKNAFEHTIQDFIQFYPFKFPKDRELFLNSVSVESNSNEVIVKLKGIEDNEFNKGYYSKNLIVIFPDGKTIQGHKITDTFIETILEFGIDKVKSLKLTFLGTSLISDCKSEKYQQKKINDECYILTALPKEKKREILEAIGKQLFVPLTARFK